MLNAALLALPSALNNAPPPQGVFDKQKRRGTDYLTLRRQMEGEGHKRDAVEWAIHYHIQAGRIEAEPGLTSNPGAYQDGRWPMKPVTKQTYDRERCVLWANPSLGMWWNNEMNPKTPLVPEPVAPTEYRMADIRDLLVYKRAKVTFEEQLRARSTNTSITAVASNAQWAALNAPPVPRLSEELAFDLAAFRYLMREANQQFACALDVDVLRCIVGDAASKSGRSSAEMWTLTVDAFGELLGLSAVSGTAEAGAPPPPAPRLSDRQELILREMLALGAVGSRKKTNRAVVVQRIDKKKTAADFARDFGVLRDAKYTNSEAGPDGGVWLTGLGKSKAETLENEAS
jgi:hypothetical protein